MDRQQRSKGYTFIEMLFVLFVLSILMLLTIPIFKINNQKTIKQVILEANLKQIDAIANCDYEVYEYDQIEIDYNRLGNVAMANTYYLDNGTIVVSLATGRIYEKE